MRISDWCSDVCSSDLQRDAVRVEGQVGRHGRVAGAQAEGARGGERPAQTAAGGRHARQCRAEGSRGKKLVRPAAQRKAVEHARQMFGISERRACTIFGVDRTSVRYAHRRSDDGDLRSRLREIAAERRRFGYRRLGIMLARKGLVMNHMKLLGLYREENLRVRRRGGRKRANGTREMTLPKGPNPRWSLDFVSDMLRSGRRIRILAVVDDFTRECLALVADTSLS